MKYELQNTPQLRFPGFEGEWKEKKIGKVFKINAGGDIDNERVSFEKTEKFKYPIYANAKKDKGFYGYSDIYKIESGTITVAGRGVYIGIAHARDHQYYPIVRLLVLKPLANDDIYFSENVINRLNLFVESTGVPQLTAPQFSNYKIALPTLPEQQKIASFLSAVDEKIQQLSRKKELLEQYKKGVMQQLFSGKMRFKNENGDDYSDCEEKKLGEVLNQQIREISKPLDNYLAIGIRSHVKGTFQKPDSDPSKIAMDKLFVVKENDLIINITFAWEGAIAIVKKEDDGGLVSHRFPTYTFNSRYLLREYFAQVIIDKKLRMILDLISPGGAGRNRVLSKKEFLKIDWSFPCVEEQQKIADFLSNIDAKIDNTNQQIAQTQSFKKGLLQQLFV